MVNIHFESAKFENLHNNLWDKHGEVEIFSDRSEDNKSASDNNDCVPNKWVSDYNLLEGYSLRYFLTCFKIVRSAKNLKLFDTLFHFQTDSCFTEKITPSFAASLIENKSALSTKKSHLVYKVPRARLKTAESKSGRSANTPKIED